MQNNEAIDGSKSLLDSLNYYAKIKQASKSYTANIKSMIGFVEVSIYVLQLQYKSVNTVTRKDIKAILRHQQETRDISNYKYNKIKSQMSSLFVEVVEDEVIEHNPTYGIKTN